MRGDRGRDKPVPLLPGGWGMENSPLEVHGVAEPGPSNKLPSISYRTAAITSVCPMRTRAEPRQSGNTATVWRDQWSEPINLTESGETGKFFPSTLTGRASR